MHRSPWFRLSEQRIGFCPCSSGGWEVKGQVLADLVMGTCLLVFSCLDVKSREILYLFLFIRASILIMRAVSSWLITLTLGI